MDEKKFIQMHALLLNIPNPSYAHIVLQISLTHWVKFGPKFYAQILHQTKRVSSLFPIQQQKVSHSKATKLCNE
jgi:hypothetical protein